VAIGTGSYKSIVV